MSDPVLRAHACVGARFLLHGRDPARGLDCVGLAAFAYGIGGAPTGYALRGGREAEAFALIGRLGFDAVEAPLPGDLMLLRPGPFQLHLAIATPAGFVHADAVLRRVVETPGAPRWPLLARWRRPYP